jgi:hypothetical protein
MDYNSRAVKSLRCEISAKISVVAALLHVLSCLLFLPLIDGFIFSRDSSGACQPRFSVGSPL